MKQLYGTVHDLALHCICMYVALSDSLEEVFSNVEGTSFAYNGMQRDSEERPSINSACVFHLILPLLCFNLTHFHRLTLSLEPESKKNCSVARNIGNLTYDFQCGQIWHPFLSDDSQAQDMICGTYWISMSRTWPSMKRKFCVEKR